MTSGIVVATAPAEGTTGPAALLSWEGETLLSRVVGQLSERGIDQLVVLSRPEWVRMLKEDLARAGIDADIRETAELGDVFAAIADVAETARDEVVIVQGEILAHDGAVRTLLADPRVSTGTLIELVEPGRAGWEMRVERGRVVSVASPYHSTRAPTHRFLGLLRVGPSSGATLARAAHALSTLCRGGLPAEWKREFSGKRTGPVPEPAARVDAVAVLATALVRGGVTLRCAERRVLFWARPFSPDAMRAARTEMDAIDERKLLRDSAVKAKDGFFGTFFCSPYTKYIAQWAADRGIHPNHVTVFSFLLGLSAGASFVAGSPPALIVGAALLYLTLAFDCVDGQLARYSHRFTELGAWLDPMFDRWKEYGVYAALAAGAVRHGEDRGALWLLAGATMTLQTVRHMMEFAFASRQHQVIAALPKSPLEVPDDVPPRAAAPPVSSAEGTRALTRAILDRSEQANRVGVLEWIKRIIQFPIGERYAAISLGAALGGARTVFVTMLVWGGVSLGYSLTSRILRSMA